MPSRPITILGGGNTAFASAARLALDGHTVTLCELPQFAENVAPIETSKTITLTQDGQEQVAELHDVTTDVRRGVNAAGLLLVMVPAYAHSAFAEACAPHLRRGKTVVLMPGTLGSLEWARILSEHGVTGVAIAEVDTSPYVCRRTGPAEATIWGAVTGLGLGVLPATSTEEVAADLAPIFPGITAYSDAAECGLSSLNPVVHPAGVLMNAGRIEHSDGEFFFYGEGVTPSVAKVIMAVDKERRAIGEKLGYTLTPVNESFSNAGFGPAGDLVETIKQSDMLTQLKAPGSMENRWLTEDMPYGIATWSLLGEKLGVETPIMRSVIELCSVVVGASAWDSARTLEDLGIADLSPAVLRRFLRSGEK